MRFRLDQTGAEVHEGVPECFCSVAAAAAAVQEVVLLSYDAEHLLVAA